MLYAREPEILIRLPEVQRRTGLRKTLIYDLINKGEFPRQVRLAARVSAWRASEIAAWIASRQPAE